MVFKWNDALVSKMYRSVETGVDSAVEEVYKETFHLVLNTPKTGRLYKRKGGRVHQASAPGESFANDTGNALRNMKKERRKYVGEVVADYEYALALELGTEKMAPRPTLSRALQNQSQFLTSIVSKPLKDVLKND